MIAGKSPERGTPRVDGRDSSIAVLLSPGIYKVHAGHLLRTEHPADMQFLAESHRTELNAPSSTRGTNVFDIHKAQQNGYTLIDLTSVIEGDHIIQNGLRRQNRRLEVELGPNNNVEGLSLREMGEDLEGTAGSGIFLYRTE